MPIPCNQWLALSLALAILMVVYVSGLCYRLQRLNYRLQEQLRFTREAEYNANHDFLTGLLNRRGWDHVLQDAIARHAQEPRISNSAKPRSAETLSLALLDLDQFKQINDQHGHLVGDQVLASFARKLRSEFTDVTGESIARIGGEEFAILSHQPPDALYALMNRFIESLQSDRIQVADKLIQLGCSVGISEIKNNEQVAEWIDRTDQAMYRAKQQGGNCIGRS